MLYVALALLGGCTINLGENADEGSAMGSNTDDAGQSTAPSGATASGVMASKTIDEQGGTLESPDGNLMLTIPRETLANPIEVSIQVSFDPPAGAIGTVYELGPDGTVFSQPVMVEFRADSIAKPPGDSASSGLRPASYDPSLNQWVPYEAYIVDSANGSIVGMITHLSQHGIVGAGTDSVSESGSAVPLCGGTFVWGPNGELGTIPLECEGTTWCVPPGDWSCCEQQRPCEPGELCTVDEFSGVAHCDVPVAPRPEGESLLWRVCESETARLNLACPYYSAIRDVPICPLNGGSLSCPTSLQGTWCQNAECGIIFKCSIDEPEWGDLPSGVDCSLFTVPPAR